MNVCNGCKTGTLKILMKHGWILYNKSFEDNKKFTEHIDWFLKTSKDFDINLEAKSNVDVIFSFSDSIKSNQVQDNKPDFVIFFDKDIRLAQSLEAVGIKVFNNSKAIEICDDKTLTQLILSKNNIKTPTTIICPKSFFGFQEKDLSFLQEVATELSFPLVLKEAFGSFGNEVYLIKNKEQLLAKTLELSSKQIMFQEYIKESSGKDIRIHIVGGEFIGAVMRTNSQDFRANASIGGTMTAYTPTAEEITLAKNACLVIGLDFAGVDILFGKSGPLICEINSNAHMKNFFNATGIDVVKKIFEHILKRI